MLGSAGIAQAVAASVTLPSDSARPATPKSPLPQSRSRAGRLSTPYAAKVVAVMRADEGVRRLRSSRDRLVRRFALRARGFVAAVRARLPPLVDCLTPNLAEAALLLGEPIARSEADMERQGCALLALGPRAALMRVGISRATRRLTCSSRLGRPSLAAPRLASGNLHGSGCYAVERGRGLLDSGPVAVGGGRAAKRFAREAIEKGGEASRSEAARVRSSRSIFAGAADFAAGLR